jgi:hypothetical protein
MPTHNALATWAIIDQLTSLLPKDSEEVNLQVKWLHAMLDAATMMDPALNPEVGRRGQDPAHLQSPRGDSAISFSHSPDERGQGHGTGDAQDIIHSRDARNRIKNRHRDNDHAARERRNQWDYDSYGPYYDQPARRRSPTGGQNEGGINVLCHDLRRVRWLLNFKPSGIDKYNGSTNPIEWLEVYQLAIEAVGGDSYVMANYLPICLSSSARTWLMGLPTGSICSWSDLCWQFVSNFWTTCERPGVDWDLANVIQKKGEYL